VDKVTQTAIKIGSLVIIFSKSGLTFMIARPPRCLMEDIGIEEAMDVLAEILELLTSSVTTDAEALLYDAAACVREAKRFIVKREADDGRIQRA